MTSWNPIPVGTCMPEPMHNNPLSAQLLVLAAVLLAERKSSDTDEKITDSITVKSVLGDRSGALKRLRIRSDAAMTVQNYLNQLRMNLRFAETVETADELLFAVSDQLPANPEAPRMLVLTGNTLHAAHADETPVSAEQSARYQEILKQIAENPTARICDLLRANVKADTAETESQAKLQHNGTSAEETVRSAWTAVLEYDDFQDDTPFFDAGGNSLLLHRLKYELTERFGAEISVADLMEYTTVRQIAAYFRKQQKAGEA